MSKYLQKCISYNLLFSSCHPKEESVDPCEPNPCGPHAYCTPTGDKNSALCTCQLGYFGDPCRPASYYKNHTR